MGIPSRDFDRSVAFYTGVLELVQHDRRRNWLLARDGSSVHLLPAPAAGQEPAPSDLSRHLALEVERLEPVLQRLLEHGLQPFQAGLQGDTKPVTEPDDPLDFGIGTLMVRDPDGNVVEFVQLGRGIYEERA